MLATDWPNRIPALAERPHPDGPVGYHGANYEAAVWGQEESGMKLDELEAAGWIKHLTVDVASKELLAAAEERGWEVTQTEVLNGED